MKTISVRMIIILTVICLGANAQKDSSGVYLNATDFMQRKLSYAINCKTEKHKINPNLLLLNAHYADRSRESGVRRDSK